MKVLLIPMLGLLLMPASEASADDARPVHLILLSGQSNMANHARSSNFTI